MSRLGAGLLALALLAPACRGTPPPPLVSVSDGRYVMGTVLEITLVGTEGTVSRADLEPLFAEAARLEAIFTRWEESSALSRLNAAAGSGPQAVPAELAAILADAKRYAAQSEGSFDVSVGPLVALWMQASRRDRAPSAAALAAARSRVGSQGIRLLPDARVELAAPGMAIDLGGLAKGWALDRLAERLRAARIDRALLSFGQSSLLALGAPADAPAWRTLLRDADGGFAGTLGLRDTALSVSGSLGRWSTIAGRRVGHVLDPRSGQPMTRAFQAAVVAQSAGEAEAWSKALLVLGEERGLALLEARSGVEGMLQDEAGERWETPGWEQAVHFEPLAPAPH